LTQKMKRTSFQSLEYLQFDSLPFDRYTHAVFTRKGGMSPAPWKTLNFGGTVGDDRERVLQNRRIALRALTLDSTALHEVWQVHSGDIHRVEAPRTAEGQVHADGMVTDRSGIALLMRFADCVPILAIDPQRHAVGIAHAGWKGTLRQVSANLVRTMVSEYGTDPSSLKVAIGPSIGPDHYTIGTEVESQVRQAFGPDADDHLRQNADHIHFDLWSANATQLRTEGVDPKNIENPQICTACNLTDWYSHRGELGSTGRFGAVILIND
jgi:YfiH family protein